MASTRQQQAKAASKPSPLTDDLIDALQDPRVIEAFGKAFTPLITKTVEAAVAPFAKRLEELNSTVKELHTENARLTKKCETTEKENARLQKIVDTHSRRLDDIESYSRSDNLIIRGIPERSAAERASDGPPLGGGSLHESHESVETTILEFFNSTLGVGIKSQDVSIAHRIKPGPQDRIRPIIVRFNNRMARLAVLRARKTLKDSNDKIFISEHLTKSASDLFYNARKLLREKKIFGTWTQNGQVYVRFSPDPATRASLITCDADLALKP